MMKKLLVILGPTSTGKTDIALQLASKFQGELISCDSRQVYRGLDIGTGKLPGSGRWAARGEPRRRREVRRENKKWEVGGINIWMYDVVNPKVQFTVKDYVEQAQVVMADIQKRRKLPIIVGGTGLYLKALLEGLSNLDIPVDSRLRGELQALTLTELQGKLKQLSPAKWASLNNSERNNKRRLLRSIELILMNPYRRTSQKSPPKTRLAILKIGLTAPRPFLYKKIDLRVVSRIKQGMIEEAKRLHRQGLSLERMRELGLEYGQLANLLEGKINEDQFVLRLQTKIHQYAKRQLTWFKREKEIFWFDVSESFYKKVEKLVSVWYDAQYDKKS